VDHLDHAAEVADALGVARLDPDAVLLLHDLADLDHVERVEVELLHRRVGLDEVRLDVELVHEEPSDQALDLFLRDRLRRRFHLGPSFQFRPLGRRQP
jgi:hypothetical protein